MDATTVFVFFALAIVAIVALGRSVRGKVDANGAGINTYVESPRKGASTKKGR